MRSRPESACRAPPEPWVAARATRLPITGAKPNVVSHTRLVTVAIRLSFPRFVMGVDSFRAGARRNESCSRLRLPDVVACVLHLEEEHHLVIFVQRVVTVDRITAAEVAEPHDYFDLLVLTQTDHIFPRELHVAALNLPAVTPDDAEFLQVDVNGMLPAAGVVA